MAGNEYKGVYETTKLSEAGDWYLSGGNFSDAGTYFGKYGKTVPVPALTGYIRAVADQKGCILIEESNGSTTIINAVNIDVIGAPEGWYTLGGVKLEGQPTQKGVYINNGKKIVIK